MKKCPDCNYEDLSFIAASDDPQKGYAFNVYICNFCSTLIKDDVWKKETVSINYENEVTTNGKSTQEN